MISVNNTIILMAATALMVWGATALRYQKTIGLLEEQVAARNAAIDTQNQLIKKIQEIEDDYSQRLHNVTLSERNAYDKRLRDETSRLSAKYANSAAECKDARASASMCYRLLGELDDLAGAYAGYADKAKVAADACNAAWRKLR